MRLFEFVCVCLSVFLFVCECVCGVAGCLSLSFFVKVCVSISLSLSVCVFESLRFFVFNSSVRSPSYENIHAGTFHAITSVSKLKYVFLAQTMKSKLLCLVS